MVLPFYIFLSLLSLAYLGIMWRYIFYWQKLPVWETPVDYPPSTRLSIIIPARNEAQNIQTCLETIFNQKYPPDLFEVIVIDDHSTDDTLPLLKSMANENLKIIELEKVLKTDQVRSFKKKALEFGIKASTGDLIITTDADCIVPERWLQRIAHYYEQQNYKFIAAPVNFHREQNLLEFFQSLDFTGMMGITGAGIYGRFMRMCNGANLAYEKKSFYAVDGFSGIDHLASGDDMLLMQKMAAQYPNQIGFLKNNKATVMTQAQPDWKSFFNQRLRWASKSSDYTEWQVTFSLGLVWLFCWAIVLNFLSIPFVGIPAILSFGLMILVKSLIDYFLLSRTTRFFGRKDLMRYFLLSQFLHILYIVTIGTLSIFKKKYLWKGRNTQ